MQIRIKRLVSPVPRVYLDGDDLAHRAREAEERGMLCGTALEHVRLAYQLRLMEIAVLDGIAVWRLQGTSRSDLRPQLEEIPFLPQVPIADSVVSGHVSFRYLPDMDRVLLFVGARSLPPPEQMALWEEARCLRLRHLAYLVQPGDRDEIVEVHTAHLRDIQGLHEEEEEVARLCRAFDTELQAATGGAFDPGLHESIAEWDDDRHLLRTGWVPRAHSDHLRWLVL